MLKLKNLFKRKESALERNVITIQVEEDAF